MVEPIASGEKLTKKFYMDLVAGVFLVSDCGGFSPLDPRVFEDYVVSSNQRATQWAQIKDARADQRGCSVFSSREDYQEWQKGWKLRSDGRGWSRK